jgi:hypothetical protein
MADKSGDIGMYITKIPRVFALVHCIFGGRFPFRDELVCFVLRGAQMVCAVHVLLQVSLFPPVGVVRSHLLP